METTLVSTDGRMDKDDVGYVCVCILECIVECYLVLKKEILPFATWMVQHGWTSEALF